MFNGNLVIRLRKEQHRSVRSLVSFVFGESSHITMKYFKDKVHIDSRHIEKLSEFSKFQSKTFFCRMKNMNLATLELMFITSIIQRLTLILVQS